MRYFMLDRVTALNPGESAAAVKNISLSDDVLHDHFPDYPIFPGALVVEAMAQLGGFLLEMSINRPEMIRRALLAQIDQAKFYRPAEPGDQILLYAQMAEQMVDAARVKIRLDISGEKMALAKLTFALREIDSEKIHQQRRYVYRLWTRHLKSVPQIL
jgi:3-hydroxyacyl-[acyl-carrier-protein] dehydratase